MLRREGFRAAALLRRFSLTFAKQWGISPEENPKRSYPAPSTVIRSVLRAAVADEYYSAKQDGFARSVPTIVDADVQADIYSIANTFLEEMISIGAYTDSMGNNTSRRTIAAALATRDGHPADIARLALLDSLQHGLQLILACLRAGPEDVFLSEAPSSPVYAAIAELVGFQTRGVESFRGFGEFKASLRALCGELRASGLRPKALLLSQPNRHTGVAFSAGEIAEVLEVAHEQGLVLLIDESQQDQPCGAQPFTSFDKVLAEAAGQQPWAETALITALSSARSLHPEPSCPGAAFRFHNFDDEVFSVFVKMFSLNLCSSTLGQIAVALCFGLQNMAPSLNNATRCRIDEERRVALEQLAHNGQLLQRHLASAGMQVWPSSFGAHVWARHSLPQSCTPQDVQAYCDAVFEATGIEAVPGSRLSSTDEYLRFSKTFKPRDLVEQALENVHKRFIS